jgi:peptidoglycan/xylan/chitin deacetylase (PgdA/CDA1 family)
MAVPGLKIARFWVRWLRNVGAAKAVILGYHRVIDTAWDPFGLAVSPAHFAEHLEAIKRYGTPLRLDELASSLRSGEVPDRAVVVTLDDGYLDNLRVALPLLRERQIPATVFAVSGCFGQEYWWDELARRFAPENPLPPHIVVEDSTRRIEIPLPRGHARTERLQALRNLHDVLFALPRESTLKVLDQLRPEGSEGQEDEPRHRCMTTAELRELARDDLIEIGAHSESHRPMEYLSESAQADEIAAGKTALEQLIARPVRSFSYPHGSYVGSLDELVENAGHTCSCGAHENVVRSHSNIYNLPRLWAADCDGRKFSRWLRFWLCT